MNGPRDTGIAVGRREFLLGSFRRGDGPLGPPPPALLARLSEGGTCLDCDAPCVPACPPAIVRLHPPGHPLAGRPYLDFAENGCTFCNDCVTACPTTQPPDGVQARVGIAVVDEEACIVGEQVSCMTCRLACDVRAIRIDEHRRPRVDGAACSGCGACVGPCPTQAIKILG